MLRSRFAVDLNANVHKNLIGSRSVETYRSNCCFSAMDYFGVGINRIASILCTFRARTSDMKGSYSDLLLNQNVMDRNEFRIWIGTVGYCQCEDASKIAFVCFGEKKKIETICESRFQFLLVLELVKLPLFVSEIRR